MTLDEILKIFNISKNDVEQKDSTFIYKIKDCDEYSKFYSILDENDSFIVDETTTMLTDDIDLTFNSTDDKYKISLIGDLDKNSYKLEIKEQEE